MGGMAADGDKLRVFMYEPSFTRPALGHVRRLTLVARYIAAAYETDIVFATGISPGAMPFDMPDSVRQVELPATGETGDAPQTPTARELAVRKRALYAAMEAHDPHIVIVDFKPRGYRGELAEWLQGERRCVRIHTQRDVIQEAGPLLYTWGPDSLHPGVRDGVQCIVDHFDEVWAVGDDCDPSPFAGLPGCEAIPLVRLGYFSEPPGGRQEAPRVPPDLPFSPDTPFVLVAGGGGSTAADVYSRVLQVYQQRSASGTAAGLPHCAICCGPFLPAAVAEELCAGAEGAGGRVAVCAQGDVPSILQARNCVGAITMAGCNTMSELLTSGVQAFVVPHAVKPLDGDLSRNQTGTVWMRTEQRERARRFAARHPHIRAMKCANELTAEAAEAALLELGRGAERRPCPHPPTADIIRARLAALLAQTRQQRL
eukprot:TRINITY_DN6097_c0_g1_i3.p1 TRINITY_DN6097_c0_g1~~TRINITY_DN6097_c0_g1_i3.p1  ORF type:complete len:457 (+),score=117.92 TRINITY_DN6097_c0_g1_i3:88-1371(+)